MEKIRRITLLGSLLIVSLSSYSCATIVNGKKQDVHISSNPSSVEVYIVPDNINMVTPGEVSLNRNKDYYIYFKKEGYLDSRAIIKSKISRWWWGSCLAGGLIGYSIDKSKGGIYKLEPDHLFVQLQKETISSDIKEQSVQPDYGPEDKKHLGNLEEELNRLERMRAEGLITDDEYSNLIKKLVDKK